MPLNGTGRAFADELLRREPTLDVLFNVSGVMQTNPVRQPSGDGASS